jgi:tetratricopeptide (TPR) repeat protein
MNRWTRPSHFFARFWENLLASACRSNGPRPRIVLGLRSQCLAGEEDTVLLEEAPAAFREALKETPRERVPRQWAATQNNLGNALLLLGVGESRTVKLEEAVEAYREALQELTRARVPLDWAATQMNLGVALASLVARESGTARLEEAVSA